MCGWGAHWWGQREGVVVGGWVVLGCAAVWPGASPVPQSECAPLHMCNLPTHGLFPLLPSARLCQRQDLQVQQRRMRAAGMLPRIRVGKGGEAAARQRGDRLLLLLLLSCGRAGGQGAAPVSLHGGQRGCRCVRLLEVVKSQGDISQGPQLLNCRPHGLCQQLLPPPYTAP